MTELVEQLKAEHRALVSQLDEIRGNIDKKTGKLPVEKAAETLRIVKEVLLAHIGKEDEKLYPVLRRAAATDIQIEALLKRFGDEMSKISVEALGFFEKYSTQGLLTRAFGPDFERLYGVLEARIRAEETELYPAYDRVHESHAVTTNKKSGSRGLAWLALAGALLAGGLLYKLL